MKMLLVKTSSLGDVVHMLPAITDAVQQRTNLQIDWVVEENFAEVPAWHQGVHKILPIALRRWRKQLFFAVTRHEIQQFMHTLQAENYDLILDTQGLLKSAAIACLARGTRHGYDRHSIREPLASWCYQQRHTVSRQQHAITRNRLLTAAALGYTMDAMPMNYGITQTTFSSPTIDLPQRYIIAFHGTSRRAKEWSESYWQALIQAMAERGIHTLLPWGNAREQTRAEYLAKHTYAHALPHCSLSQLAAIIQGAIGIIGMDTGLMHIAAALNQRCMALYPATEPELTGLMSNDNTPNPIVTLAGDNTADTAIVLHRFANLVDS